MSKRNITHIYTIDDLVSVSDYLGCPFFSKATMKHFGTRLQNIFDVVSLGNRDGQPAIGWFVTSEDSIEAYFGGGPGRQFVLRRYVVQESDEWDPTDRRDVISFESVASGLTRAVAKRLSMHAAAQEKLNGYDAALQFVQDALAQAE